MARHLFVLEEVLAILEGIGASKGTRDNFRQHAERVSAGKPRHEFDTITVASGFGQKTQRGFVELTLNDQLTQLEAKKAREIGLMLLECAEAAQSDETFVGLLKQMGLEKSEDHGRILIELRQIRQGTRGVSWPT